MLNYTTDQHAKPIQIPWFICILLGAPAASNVLQGVSNGFEKNSGQGYMSSLLDFGFLYTFSLHIFHL